MKQYRLLLFISLLLFSGLSCFGQGTGFELLRTGPNTVALGLNETTSTYLLGASDIYSNPANLAFETASGFNADYALWIGDLTNTHAAVHFKKNNGAIGFGLLASEAGDFELRDRPGPSQGSFSVSYLALSGAYAQSFKNIAIGATLHYLREELYIYNASGYAFNAGISSHWLDKQLIVSAVMLNMGKMDKLNNDRTSLPSRLKGGIQAKVYQTNSRTDGFPLTFHLLSDLVIPLDGDNVPSETPSDTSEDAYLNIGFSTRLANMVSLRAGYKTGQTARPLSFGLGVALSQIKINYALVPFETGFGTVHSVGLGYRF